VKAAIDRQVDADHEAGTGAAQPQHGGRNLVCPTKPADRLLLHDLGHGVGLALQHVLHHRRVDRAGADGVDADATWRIFDACTLGRAQHGVLGAVISRAFGQPDQAAQRRAVDDGA
jgi:hypothetical protein